MAEFIINVIVDVVTDIWTLQCRALAAEEGGRRSGGVRSKIRLT
ncbi:hypothetical protein QMZ05_08800 [Bradyrhizobium sp. INPA03-11B]